MAETIKAIETEYKGYRFRSRLEARWAVFFDSIGADWEYEPEGFNLGDGLWYLPDFLLHNVTAGRSPEDGELYVEVKGVLDEASRAKIYAFSKNKSILVVSEIPSGDSTLDMFSVAEEHYGYNDFIFNFGTVDGDYYPCILAAGENNRVGLFGPDWADEEGFDLAKNKVAFDVARTFDFNRKEKTVEVNVIKTRYKGISFRTRLDARWAVFFDACGVEWEYKEDSTNDGIPDFLLHGVSGRTGATDGDLYVSVKGNKTEASAERLKKFIQDNKKLDVHGIPVFAKPVLIVGAIPKGDSINEITAYCVDLGCDYKFGLCQFNFETIDGDYFVAHPGVNIEGQFELFGSDSNYLAFRDDEKTFEAYLRARQARFETIGRRFGIGGAQVRLPPTWVRDLQKDRDTVMELTAHLSEPQKGRIYQAMSMAVPVKALPAEWAGDVTCPCCAETLNKATLMYCPNCGQRLSVEEWAEVYNDDF